MVFETHSKLSKKISLAEVQWLHIKNRHQELENQIEKMTLTLQEPNIIYYSPYDEVFHYYKYFEETPVTEKYLLLVVKHLNLEGFIITAFFVSKIKTKEKEVVYG